jgi:hypothetical protein
MKMTEQARKNLQKCENCYNKKLLAGQAFTKYQCQYCHKTFNHPNTAAPIMCLPCAITKNQCSYCLKKMD